MIEGLKITSWKNCGVGNKLLHYWNLRQEANRRNVPWYVTPDETVQSLIHIKGCDLLHTVKEEFPFTLGEGFFNPIYSGASRLPIHEVFSTVAENKATLEPSRRVSIHLRGRDFRIWKGGEGLLSLKYYTDAFDYFLAETTFFSWIYHVQIVSDDPHHPHLIPLQNYIKGHCGGRIQMIPYTPQSIQDDWMNMVKSEWIISSPSTFAITAGMVSNARIIHSEKWVKDRVNDEDLFWVGLDNGGNKEYSAEVLV